MGSENHYALPSSPTNRCVDRFSITVDTEEDENGQIPFWALLSELLFGDITSPETLIDLLETISVTTHDSSGLAGDYGTLRKFLASRPKFFQTQWPTLVKIALSMPQLFPGNTLPVLERDRAANSVQLSRKQVGCLVIHQFLGTLKAPSWKDDGLHDFAAWYGNEQRHLQAVSAYLESLFSYFDKLVTFSGDSEASGEDSPVCYALRDSSSIRAGIFNNVSNETVPLSELTVRIVERYSTDPSALGLPHGACVVSANRFVGFGQSATQ